MTARGAYETLDAAVVVLAADPPFTASDRALLREVRPRSVSTFVVVNKVDRLNSAEREEVLRFTENECASAGLGSAVFMVVARDRDDGYLTFERAVVDYVTSAGAGDAHRSVSRQALALVAEIGDRLSLERAAVDCARRRGGERIAAFAAALARVRAKIDKLDARCAADRDLALRELRQQSQLLVARVAQDAATDVSRQWSSDVHGRADLRARSTRASAVALVLRDVEAWRAGAAVRLEHALTATVDDVTADVRRVADDLRTAAREDLGVDLALPVDPPTLPASDRFWFDTGAPTGWQMPGTDALRRRGPGAAGRLRRHLDRELPDLVDKQVGRARADLQQRYDEGVRQIRSQVRSPLSSVHDGLRTSLAAATSQGAEAEHDGNAHLRSLRSQVEQVSRIRDLLSTERRSTGPSDGLTCMGEPR